MSRERLTTSSRKTVLVQCQSMDKSDQLEHSDLAKMYSKVQQDEWLQRV